MGNKQFLTKPDRNETRLPGGIPYIVGNEAAERFSFYGMRAILVVFMTQYLVDASHNDASMTDEKAKSVFHLFVGLAYFTPMLGALIADIFWGKYKTILYISLMYCAGHGCLALMDLGPITGAWDMRPFMYSGLFLIALGAGGIKPCVSAHVGDQFGTGNKRFMTQVFNWFYFSINVGAAASQLLTPWLLSEFGPWLAFGLPGVLMGIATFVFWLGRHQFVHVPPAGWKQWKAETLSPEGRRALLNLSPLFLLFVPMFWAIFDQTGSAWVIQADQMNRDLGIVWDPSQIQFINPIMILCGIPIFTYVVYPFFGKFMKVTPLRKIGVGLFLTAGSFAVSGLVETSIVDKSPGIARTMYTDLSTDLKSETFTGPQGLEDANSDGYFGDMIKSTLNVAMDNGTSQSAISSATGLTTEQMYQLVPEDRFDRIMTTDDAAVFITNVWMNRQGDIPELVSSAMSDSVKRQLSTRTLGNMTRTAIEEGLALGWDEDRFAAAGLRYASLARAIPNEELGARITPSDVSEIITLIADEEDVSLAQSVKIARTVWMTQGLGKLTSDEQKIVSYLEQMPSIVWQFIAYFILTSAEILVSIVCLEFAYTQSPKKMKSLVMGVFFLGVSLANFFVSGVNAVLGAYQASSGVNLLEGASYYWFFCILMLLVAIAYTFWAPFYKGETYIQGEGEEEIIEAEAEAEGTEVR